MADESVMNASPGCFSLLYVLVNKDLYPSSHTQTHTFFFPVNSIFTCVLFNVNNSSNHTVPNWRDYLLLSNTLLKTMSLLREIP